MAAFTQLWNRQSHVLRLQSTVSGSVIARIHVDSTADAAGAGAALTRFDQLAAAVGNSASPDMRDAVLLNIPIEAVTRETTAADVGLVIGVVVAVCLVALIVVGVLLLVRYKRSGGSPGGGYRLHNDDLGAPMVQQPPREVVIGEPYNLKHDQGESVVLDRLVPLKVAQASHGPDKSAPELKGGKAKQFRLLADIRDAGEGVLTGEKAGTLGSVDVSDLTGADWIWASINGRTGWYDLEWVLRVVMFDGVGNAGCLATTWKCFDALFLLKKRRYLCPLVERGTATCVCVCVCVYGLVCRPFSRPKHACAFVPCARRVTRDGCRAGTPETRREGIGEDAG